MKPSKISKEEYGFFTENDDELALMYGNDLEFLKRNSAEFN